MICSIWKVQSFPVQILSIYSGCDVLPQFISQSRSPGLFTVSEEEIMPANMCQLSREGGKKEANL